MVGDLGCSRICSWPDGVRTADSPMRLVAIRRHGPSGQRNVDTIRSTTGARRTLCRCFRKARCGLPVDYRLFGRSFDGIDLRFVLPLKRYRYVGLSPRASEWFPLVELEVFRWERAHAH